MTAFTVLVLLTLTILGIRAVAGGTPLVKVTRVARATRRGHA